MEIRKGQEQRDLLGEVGGEGAGGMNQGKKMRKSDTELDFVEGGGSMSLWSKSLIQRNF